MPTKDIQNFHISTSTMVRFLAILLFVVVVYIVSDVLISLFLAIIVASAIEPAIEWLKARHVPRILGVILIYLAFALMAFFVVYLLLPLLLDEFRNVAANYPALQERVISGLEDTRSIPFSSFFSENLAELLKSSAGYLEKFSGGIVNFASAVFGGIFSAVLTVIFSFYLAAQEKGIEGFLRLVTPLKYEPYIVDLWERAQRKLGRWLRAQMLLGAIVGVLIFFGLTLLGVKHAMIFAVVAALFEIIPIVGPILAAVPAVATALLASPLLGLFTAVLYFGVQQIESQVIVPVVMKKAVGLSPLLVVLALLMGVKLGGIFGILLAVPITAIVAEFVNDWDKKKRALIPE